MRQCDALKHTGLSCRLTLTMDSRPKFLFQLTQKEMCSKLNDLLRASNRTDFMDKSESFEAN